MTWNDYHQFTKHSVQSLRRTQHVLDWDNMPDPFRHYEGAPVLDLPADPTSPEIPALAVLQGDHGASQAPDGAAFLSQLLFHSAAISASKIAPVTGSRYALRVNPSSGNLHPTEFHFLTRGLKNWPDGLYHYRPSSHMAEQRAVGDIQLDLAGDPAPITFVLTSIAWREAWKYRDRAYRYCLHDMGHAWQALALAAQAVGCGTWAMGRFPDDEVARSCRLHPDEWPMLIVKLYGESIPVSESAGAGAVWFEGCANQLSVHQVDYPWIRKIHTATKVTDCNNLDVRPTVRMETGPVEGHDRVTLTAPASSARGFGEVTRARRSALDFQGGSHSISLAQLSAILSVAARPLSADFAEASFIRLYFYAHRVDGLEPGVYRYWTQEAALEKIRTGDQRVAAAGLSLGQDLAGNACLAFSMIADLDRAAERYGDRGYRYAHFEAGAIGHRLYIAAEAFGLGATGIGAFFDDEVHAYLGLTTGQVAYHFAIGYPAPDSRLVAE